MNGNLIALYSSAPQSGKSEVAKALQERGWKVFKFASALKDMLRSLLRSSGMGELEIEAYLDGAKKETPLADFGNKTPRYLMQTLGTEWGRNLISETLWTDLLFMRVRSALREGHKVVVDDMRFPNEFGALWVLDAHMVWIQRPGVVAQTGHKSEGLLDEHAFKTVITNDRDLSALRTMVSDTLL